MKMRSKKGFTIVELVIVIAVIAILAAVMIPTFSGMVGKAKESVALQEARNEYTAYSASLDEGAGSVNLLVVTKDGYAIKVVNGQIESDVLKYDAVKDNYGTEDLTKYYAKSADPDATEDADSDPNTDETPVGPVAGKVYYTYNTTSKAYEEATNLTAFVANTDYYELLDVADAEVAIYAAK